MDENKKPIDAGDSTLTEEEKAAAEANKNAKEEGKGSKSVEEINRGLVEELKNLRIEKKTYKDLYEQEKSAKEEKPAEEKKPVEEDEVTQKIKAVLHEEDLSKAKANKEAAFVKFVNDNKIFHEENDPGGIKQKALKDKLSRFNDEGLSSVEEFTSLIRDAHSLLVGTDKQPEDQSMNAYSSSTPNSSDSGSQQEEGEKLTPGEELLMKKTGRTKESILKIRKSNPEFLEQIISEIRD